MEKDGQIQSVLECGRLQSYACAADSAISLVDVRALCYLEEFLQEISAHQKHPNQVIVPLRTLPNGNCLVNAVSLAVSGNEGSSDALREEMAKELDAYRGWYMEKLTAAHGGESQAQSEYDEALARARAPGAFLSNIHIIALASVLERPIILVASRQNMRDFGVGYHGMAGAFLPLRFLTEASDAAKTTTTATNSPAPATGDSAVKSMLSQKRPVVLAWGSEARDHFVPLTQLIFTTGTTAAEQTLGNSTLNTTPTVGFPVPAPTAAVSLAAGQLPDPFFPPHIPALWIDTLCRSLAEHYCGCWDLPWTRAATPPPADSIARTAPGSSDHGQHHNHTAPASAPTSLRLLSPFARPRELNTAVDVLLLLKHSHAGCGEEYVAVLETMTIFAASFASASKIFKCDALKFVAGVGFG